MSGRHENRRRVEIGFILALDDLVGTILHPLKHPTLRPRTSERRPDVTESTASEKYRLSALSTDTFQAFGDTIQRGELLWAAPTKLVIS